MATPQLIQLGMLGWADSLILMVIALVVFGPRKLPEIGRQIGKLMYEFRKASNDFKYQMEEELRNAEEADRRNKEEERQRALALAAPAAVAIDPQESTPHQVQVEATSDESFPRILPPSTGEQVPGGRHSSLSAQSPITEETAVEVSSDMSIHSETEIAPIPVTDGASSNGSGADPSLIASPTSNPDLSADKEQAVHHG